MGVTGSVTASGKLAGNNLPPPVYITLPPTVLLVVLALVMQFITICNIYYIICNVACVAEAIS